MRLLAALLLLFLVPASSGAAAELASPIDVDRTPPPPPVIKINESTIPAIFSVTATDSLSGVASIEYRIDGGAWQAYTNPVPVVAAGVHVVEARATDRAGNVSLPARQTVNTSAEIPRCASDPADYPDAAQAPTVPRFEFASLPLDPEFQKIGVKLITFRTSELVFHVSPDISQAVVDCAVVAADASVGFVAKTLNLAAQPGGGPSRHVYLLSPATWWDDLEKMDPGRRLGYDRERDGGATNWPEYPYQGIFWFRDFEKSYLEMGFFFAHEWTHMVQGHYGAFSSNTPDFVIEGEANYLACLWQDSVVPGYSTIFWDRDLQEITRSRSAHPGLAIRQLIDQPPHLYHQEISLFAYAARGVDLATLGRVHARQKEGGRTYEEAWREVVGRDLYEPGLEQIILKPETTPRNPLPVTAPRMTVTRTDGGVNFVAVGFRPGERLIRRIRFANGTVATDVLVADSRGAVAFGWTLGQGTRYVAREIEVSGAAGTVSGRYYALEP